MNKLCTRLLEAPLTSREREWLQERLEALSVREEVQLAAALMQTGPQTSQQSVNCLLSLPDYEVCHPAGSYEDLGRYALRYELSLPAELAERLDRACPETVPPRVLRTLVAYYIANRPEDSDWVVLPVINFDCYFGDTNFGRKYLAMLPDEVIQRNSSFGVSRYRVREEYLSN